MATFILTGKYSLPALQEISAARTQKVLELVRRFGGEVKDLYATLGPHDLVLIVTLPGIEAAMQVSVALTKLTGIAFSTSPAVPVAEFDRLMSEV